LARCSDWRVESSLRLEIGVQRRRYNSQIRTLPKLPAKEAEATCMSANSGGARFPYRAAPAKSAHVSTNSQGSKVKWPALHIEVFGF
jgi:hypothetical protein